MPGKPAILFLTSRFPYPPDRGDRLRAYNILMAARERFEVDLFSLYDGDEETGHIEHMRSVCRQVFAVKQSKVQSAVSVAVNMIKGEPMQVSYYRNRKAFELAKKVFRQNRYALVYTHLLRMAPYAHLAGPAVKKVLDLTDCISHEYRLSMPYRKGLSKLIYTLETPRLEEMEGKAPLEFSDNWVISDNDLENIKNLCGSAPLTVTPNGVDLEKYFPNGTKPSEPESMLFVGHLSVPHNVDAVLHFANDILPLILKRKPNAKLYVVGRQPDARLAALGQGNPAVEVVGYVEDLNEYFLRAGVFVAPLRFCSGVQNKALESMAAGLPVAATPAVNQGLRAADGKEILLADSPEGFADAVCRLMDEPETWKSVREAARRFVERRFTWDRAADRLSELLDSAPNNAGRQFVKV